MFGIYGIIEDMKAEEREREWWLSYVAREDVVGPWSEDFKIDRKKDKYVFSADSWNPYTLFDCDMNKSPMSTPDTERGVSSPGGMWLYDHARWPAGRPADLVTGAVRGKWAFSSDILIPRIWQCTDYHTWKMWMSYTPFEVASQRPGIKMAKGHVVVAGLGMGWMLARVMAKKSVRRVTLVEKDQCLCDWILPAVRARHLTADKQMDVVIADARSAVPDMTADVALWDIFAGMGDVDAYDEQKMHAKCPGIGKTWFWGAHVKPGPERRSWF